MVRAFWYATHGQERLSLEERKKIQWFRYNYPEYLKTRHWYDLKEELIYSNPDAKCFICGRTDTLVIHHVNYGNLFHEKRIRDVYLLCHDCHTQVHFTILSKRKVDIEYGTLVKRVYLLKYTFGIRSFRLGSFINSLFTRR